MAIVKKHKWSGSGTMEVESQDWRSIIEDCHHNPREAKPAWPKCIADLK